ncbi:hypothetical protein [Pseudonocardia sp. WMMC193]|uniref:hypothetical protein n=1 Tax=Pseudonocardia sp. WMMC193 TaxID=2911965 RepID=UPI001F2211CC|nr:hypothetical protein [Pseudonocardia sp. WMMC193]MCF7547768.1 hypothetical protein [Pseudonocardia sp. WMMC193]
MHSDDVRAAAAACTGLLRGAVGRDWSVRAGDLDMTVAQVVAHVGESLLVHTDDAARGLGLAFEPDARLAGHVVRRLFPWAPHDERSWPTLRWANGRAPLGGRPRLADWRWHCAPLDEWDGTDPTR